MSRVVPIMLLFALGCNDVTLEPGEQSDRSDDPWEVRYIEEASEIPELVSLVVGESFPELPANRIATKGKDKAQAHFFWAQPVVGSIVNPFDETDYRVFYNTRLFNADLEIQKLPYEAARAIIAHELAHVSDYETTTFGLLRTGWTQVVHGKAEARNERRTDLDAIVRGYAEGLKTYRRWIYSTLQGKNLARKREVYFTPEEITLVAWAIDVYPELVAYWHKRPPLSLREIEADIASLDAGAILPTNVGCDEDQFDCHDGSCIESWQLCDGEAHCPGAEDEAAGCNEICPNDMFSCGSGECLPSRVECDFYLDCFDFSDEAEC